MRIGPPQHLTSPGRSRRIVLGEVEELPPRPSLLEGPLEGPPQGAGQLHLTEAPISPRPIGERPFDKRSGGPAPQAWEGEGGAQISRCFLKQTRRRKLPVTFPSLTRWVPSSPRGERKKGTSLPVAIPAHATLARLPETVARATWAPGQEAGLLLRYCGGPAPPPPPRPPASPP